MSISFGIINNSQMDFKHFVEKFMKKIIFVALFVTVLIGGIYGQTRPENRWLLGNWFGVNNSGINIEIVLNDNGTGRFTTGENMNERLFSIDGNILRFFPVDGFSIASTWNIYRISDRRLLLQSTGNPGLFLNLEKR